MYTSQRFIALACTGALLAYASGPWDALGDFGGLENSTSSDPVEVMGLLGQQMMNGLRKPGFQWFNALLALLVGGYMLWYSQKALKRVVLMIVYFLTYNLAVADFPALFNTTEMAAKLTVVSTTLHVPMWTHWLAFLVAILMTYSASESYGSVTRILGMGSGIWIVCSLHKELDYLGALPYLSWVSNIGDSNAFLMAFGSITVLGCVYLMEEGPSYTIALGMPFCGGILMSSALFYFVNMCLGSGDPAWVDFVENLFPENNVSKGVFGDAKVGKATANCFSGWVVAVLLFLIFFGMQFRSVREERRQLVLKEGNFWTRVRNRVVPCCQKATNLVQTVSRTGLTPTENAQEPLIKSA